MMIEHLLLKKIENSNKWLSPTIKNKKNKNWNISFVFTISPKE